MTPLNVLGNYFQLSWFSDLFAQLRNQRPLSRRNMRNSNSLQMMASWGTTLWSSFCGKLKRCRSAWKNRNIFSRKKQLYGRVVRRVPRLVSLTSHHMHFLRFPKEVTHLVKCCRLQGPLVAVWGKRVQVRGWHDAEDIGCGSLETSQRLTALPITRSLVEDDAKSVQSQVNQTNDTVTQQSNMATAIIQEFSTILGSLFR